MLDMMIKRKRQRRHTEDRYLALVLATSAGLLNAMALGAFGIFPSHMSGNTSQLSSEVSSVDIRDMTFLLSMIVAFVSGCVSARLLVIVGIRQNIRTIFSLILLVEGILLIAMSAFELLYYSSANNREVIVFLGFLMGIHNATSTQLSNGRVRSPYYRHADGCGHCARLFTGRALPPRPVKTGQRAAQTVYHPPDHHLFLPDRRHRGPDAV